MVKKFKEFLLEYFSNEYLEPILYDNHPTIGDEVGDKLSNGISHFKDQYGSHRYIKYINSVPVSAIQVMSRDGQVGLVTKAFTHKDHRRKGHGLDIMNKVKSDFKKVIYSDDLSDDGKAFVSKVSESLKAHKIDKSLDVIKDIYSKIKKEFESYAKKENLTIDTEEDIIFEMEYYLREEYSIDIDTDGIISFWKLDEKTEFVIGEHPICLYHITSSKLVPSIKKNGLQTGFTKTNPHGNSYAGIYLTSITSGPAIDGYKHHARQKHKKDVVLIKVKCYLNEIQPDPDDADLQSGETQFIIDRVPAERILDIEPIF